MDAPSAGRRRLSVAVLHDLLDDLGAVVMATRSDVYTALPPSRVCGSVGQHVRHLLDHVAAFLEAGSAAPLDYDRRRRGTRVETDPSDAMSAIASLQFGLERLADRDGDEHLCVRSQLRADEPSETHWSTLGRELAFVVNHTIHHQALIALVLATSQQMVLPARFGYAPSTPVAQ